MNSTIKANIQTAHEQIEQQQTLKVNLEAKLEELAAKEKQLLADMPGTDDGETWVLHADDVKFLNAGEESVSATSILVFGRRCC